MYAISLLQGMIFYGPIATLYRQAAGVTVFQIALIEAVSLALSVLLELPWGLLADRIGYRRTAVLCSVLYFLSKLVFWRARGFGGFLAERVMLSVVCAGLSGVDVSILYLSCEKERFQKVCGVYDSLNMAGLLIAAAVYARFLGGRYRLAGLLTAVGYGIAAALSFALREVRAPERRGAHDFRALLRATLRDRRLLALLAAAALLGETHQMITVFLNQLQYARAGMSDRVIALVFIAMTLAGLLSGVSARVTARFGPRKTGGALLLLGCAACASMAVWQGAILSAAAVLTLRAAFSVFQPLQTELQNRWVTTADRATALSLNAVVMESLGVAADPVFGALAQRELRAAMAFGAALCAGGFALYLAAAGGGLSRGRA